MVSCRFTSWKGATVSDRDLGYYRRDGMAPARRERRGEKAWGMSESGLSRLKDFQDIPNPVNPGHPVNPDSDNYFAQASLGRQARCRQGWGGVRIIDAWGRAGSTGAFWNGLQAEVVIALVKPVAVIN